MRKNRITFAEKCQKKFGMSLNAYLKKSAKECISLSKVAKKLGCSYVHAHYLAKNNNIKFINGNTKRSKK